VCVFKESQYKDPEAEATKRLFPKLESYIREGEHANEELKKTDPDFIRDITRELPHINFLQADRAQDFSLLETFRRDYFGESRLGTRKSEQKLQQTPSPDEVDEYVTKNLLVGGALPVREWLMGGEVVGCSGTKRAVEFREIGCGAELAVEVHDSSWFKAFLRLSSYGPIEKLPFIEEEMRPHSLGMQALVYSNFCVTLLAWYFLLRSSKKLISTPGLNPPTTVSRNAPCPCGSGKKYKRCCGAKR